MIEIVAYHWSLLVSKPPNIELNKKKNTCFQIAIISILRWTLLINIVLSCYRCSFGSCFHSLRVFFRLFSHWMNNSKSPKTVGEMFKFYKPFFGHWFHQECSYIQISYTFANHSKCKIKSTENTEKRSNQINYYEQQAISTHQIGKSQSQLKLSSHW